MTPSEEISLTSAEVTPFIETSFGSSLYGVKSFFTGPGAVWDLVYIVTLRDAPVTLDFMVGGSDVSADVQVAVTV